MSQNFMNPLGIDPIGGAVGQGLVSMDPASRNLNRLLFGQQQKHFDVATQKPAEHGFRNYDDPQAQSAYNAPDNPGHGGQPMMPMPGQMPMPFAPGTMPMMGQQQGQAQRGAPGRLMPGMQGQGQVPGMPPSPGMLQPNMSGGFGMPSGMGPAMNAGMAPMAQPPQAFGGGTPQQGPQGQQGMHSNSWMGDMFRGLFQPYSSVRQPVPSQFR